MDLKKSTRARGAASLAISNCFKSLVVFVHVLKCFGSALLDLNVAVQTDLNIAVRAVIGDLMTWIRQAALERSHTSHVIMRPLDHEHHYDETIVVSYSGLMHW
jgi:hypothetical protein